MNVVPITLKKPERSMAELADMITDIKHKKARLDQELGVLERMLIEQVGAKEEGAKTVTLDDGRKVTITGKLIYQADLAGLKALTKDWPAELIPIKTKEEADQTGLKWLRGNDPEHWSQIAVCVTLKPAKTSVEVK